jgi:ketosteroid isomerase-like protein
MKKTILFALFLFAGSLVFSQDKYEKQVAAAVESFNNAILNGDSATLDAYTDSKLTYGHSLGKVENKEEFISALASGRSDFKSLEVSDQRIWISGKTAIVRHILDAEITDNGKTSKVKLALILVWNKQKKAWKLLARQGVRLATS